MTTLPRIPDDMLLRRIAMARGVAAAWEVDGLVLFSAPRRLGGGTQTTGNVHYFTGWTPLGAGSLLVIPRRGTPTVVASGPNEARVFQARAGSFAAVRRASGAPAIADAVRTALGGGRPRAGSAGAADMPAVLRDALADACDLTPLDGALHALRLTRSAQEVALHRRAAVVSDRMVQRAMDLASVPSLTPAQMMAEVEYTGRRLGADQAAIWLAAGPAPPVTCFDLFELPPAIDEGDRIQIGTTLSYEGHFAQGLRMGIRGTPSPELRDAAAVLLHIQDQALAAIVVGRPVHTIVDTLERLIDEHCPFTRASDPFRFQSCHGLGLDYSEPGLAAALAPDRDRTGDAEGPLIIENMVFEIHPNFSLPGLGHVCAGDMAVATAEGGAWLTRFPRGLAVLD